MPIYNAEQYLPQCIESILNQTLEEIELILVNDGSTDQSGQICDNYAISDKRIRVIHQGNKGPIEARRRGLLESRCNYVTFVDADDFIDRDSYVLALSSIHNNIDVVIFGITKYFDSVNQRKELCDFPEGIYNKSEIEKVIWPKMIWNFEKEHYGIDPSLCTKIMKKKLLLSCYKDLVGSEFRYGEDVAVVYPMLKKAETLEIKNDSYYFYRQRTSGIVAEYRADADFFDKAYVFYKYLLKKFNNMQIFTKQIEYAYMHVVNLRKSIYSDYREKVYHLFPFDKVNKGERIIVYGAGVVGRSYIAQLKQLNYCRIVLWVDKNFQKYASDDILGIDEIKTVSFDKVVIAIENREINHDVKNELIEMQGIEEKKIVEYGFQSGEDI